MISWLLSRIEDEETRENITFGLTLGLIFGLIFGLTLGLIFGLIFGLTFGLIFGLTFGLTFGLISGLTLGLMSALIEFIRENLSFFSSEWMWIVLGIVLIGELLFWLEKKSPNEKENRMVFTLKRKLFNIGESALVSCLGMGGYNLVSKLIPGIQANYTTILQVGGAIFLLVVGGYIFIWLNSMKYRKLSKVKK